MNPPVAQKVEKSPNGGDTQGGDLDKDRLKALYELAKEVFNQERNRRINIDDKATKFITILGILLGAAGFFGKWLLDQHLIPPQSKLDWAALACVVAVFATIIVAWWNIVLALKLQEYTDLSIDDTVVDYFWDNDLEDIYTGYAKYVLSPAFQNNRKINNEKAQLVMQVHYAILFAVCLLILLLILVGAHAWLSHPLEAEDNIPVWLFWD